MIEDRAVEILGLESKDDLRAKMIAGELSHVSVDHGKRAKLPKPFNQHRYFYIQPEGSASGATPAVSLSQWAGICSELEFKSHQLASVESTTVDSIKLYTERTLDSESLASELQSVYDDLKAQNAITSSPELSFKDADPDTDDYPYATAPLPVRAPSKAASAPAEGEIYVRADGKKVRRVKRATSASAAQVAAGGLSGFLSGGDEQQKGESRLKKMSGAQSVAGDGEIYVRADGKKVRRVRKSVASGAPATAAAGEEKKSLTGFLEKGGPSKPKMGGSASVAGDQIAVRQENSLTGEVYVRADGKKVRRVLKKPAAAAEGENVEIITREDGTKVRRIRKVKRASGSPDKGGLSGFLDSGNSGPTKRVSGTQSVSGDMMRSSSGDDEGEIYIRADGKKVRRVRKVKPKEGTNESGSLGGFLGADSANKPKMSGSATVSGDMGSNQHQETEIYTRPDGTRVRRIRKTAVKRDSATESATESGEKKSLTGFLEKGAASAPRQKGGSASVAGDMIAVSKDSSLTGEVYVRADGKKVRRVMKKSAAAEGDNVEIITRPDGTKVRRIRKTKPKPAEGAGLGGFLESQPKAQVSAGAATVTGAQLVPSEAESSPDGPSSPPVAEAPPAEEKKSLTGFLEKSEAQPRKKGGSASVAGDMLAVSKDSSLTGEVYVRADGKKVRRVKKSAVEPGDQVEIITRPDGTKVRRIKRAKKPADGASGGGPGLGGFLASAAPAQKAGAASVAGDQLHSTDAQGEIYVRADGKKVRRVRKSAPVIDEDKYEIYVRPDGKKVRRIKRSVLEARKAEAAKAAEELTPAQRTSLADMLGRDAENAVKQLGEAATVAGDDLTGRSSLQLKSTEGEAKPASGALAPTPEEPKSEDDSTPNASADAPTEASAAAVEPTSATPEASAVAESSDVPAADIPEGMILVPTEQFIKPGMKTSTPGEDGEQGTIGGDKPKGGMVMVPSKEVDPDLPDGMMMVPAGQTQHKVPDGMTMVPKEHKDTTPIGMVSSQEPMGQTGENVPEGMALVPKDQATVEDGMVLVPKEQAEKIIPEGMVAVPKDVAGEGVPDGFVLVPKDKIQGEPGEDMVLVRKDQVNSPGPVLVMLSPEEQKKRDEEAAQRANEDVDISGANIVSMEDLPASLEKLKIDGGDGKHAPRFLLQPLPEDETMRDDFIKKNLLPAGGPATPSAPAPAPAPPKKEDAAPSPSIAELLASMSTMENFDGEKMGELLQKLQDAEKRQKKLEKQLQQAGVAVAEDIDYDTCMKKVAEIGKRMNEIGGSDVTHPDKEEQNRLREEYFKLEQDMEKYNSALMLTDEYQAEQDRIEKKWEEDNLPGNMEALRKIRRHMPVEVRNMSEAMLTEEPSPNGKYLPKATAKKFKRTNVLQIIRRHPDDVVRMHPSTLENMRVTGLTLTERRAIYAHLMPCGPQWKAQKAEKMTERKWTWYNMMKNNFKESLASYQRHVAQYGPPGAHPYATRANPNEGCPLIGKQCPLKADKLIDYDGDYGWTSDDEYEVSEVKKADVEDSGAKAMAEALELMKEKKANERSDLLKKHYKGKLLQVSKANGSCESMDESMDKMEYGLTKWIENSIEQGDDDSKLTDDVKKKELASVVDVLNDLKLLVLNFAERSGMQVSGKKTDDEKPDPRSGVECSLSMEVHEAFEIFGKYVSDRMKKLGVIDTRIKSTIDLLKGMLAELNQRSASTLSKLGQERMARSRKIKTVADFEKEIKEKKSAAAGPEESADDSGAAGGRPAPPIGAPGRGGLLDAIAGGGRVRYQYL